MYGLSIRQAAREDTHAIARIVNASWRAAYAGIVPQDVLDTLSDAEKQRRLEDGLDRFPDLSYYLLELDGVPAGAASLHPTRDEDLTNTAEFSFFYFLPQYWRGGCGTCLLTHVEQVAREHGFTRICCWALAENARAISFYEKNGYHHDGAKQTVTIGIPLEAVRLIKEL